MKKDSKIKPRSKRFYIVLAVTAALATMTLKFIGYFLTGSVGLFSDAAESVACIWLSFVVVVGLVAQLAFGVWWIDAVTSLAIVWFLVREGREAWVADEDD